MTFDFDQTCSRLLEMRSRVEDANAALRSEAARLNHELLGTAAQLAQEREDVPGSQLARLYWEAPEVKVATIAAFLRCEVGQVHKYFPSRTVEVRCPSCGELRGVTQTSRSTRVPLGLCPQCEEDRRLDRESRVPQVDARSVVLQAYLSGVQLPPPLPQTYVDLPDPVTGNLTVSALYVDEVLRSAGYR